MLWTVAHRGTQWDIMTVDPMKRSDPVVIFAAMLLAAFAATQSIPPNPPAGRWYKGNLHTHTLNSDGDSTPFEVATWYREHGYQFLVLTDHNYLTGVAGLNGTLGRCGEVPADSRRGTERQLRQAAIPCERVQPGRGAAAAKGRVDGGEHPEQHHGYPAGAGAAVAESSEFPLGGFGGGNAGGQRPDTLRDLQRPSRSEQRGWRRRSVARPDVGRAVDRRP